MFFLHNNCHILQYITIHYKLKGIRHLIPYLTASYFPLSVQDKNHHFVPFNNLKFKPYIDSWQPCLENFKHYSLNSK